MARLFISLKLRLQRNLAASLGTVWFVPLAWTAGLVLAFGGFLQLAQVRSLEPASAAGPAGDGGPFLVVTCTVVFASWVAAPLLAGAAGGDQLIDLRVLAPLPLTQRDLLIGLLAASFVGVMPTATALGMSGAAVGYGVDAVTVAIALVAAVVLAVQCVVGSRLVASTVGRLLRSRRRGHLQVVAVALLAVGIFLLLNAFRGDPDELLRLEATTLTRALAVTPPGALGQAVVSSRDGDVASALALVVYATAATVAMGLGWSRVLARGAVTADAPPAARRADRPVGRLALHPGRVATTPPDDTHDTSVTVSASTSASTSGATRDVADVRRAGVSVAVMAVVAKELRYVVREVRQLQQLVVGGVIALFTLVTTLVADDGGMKAYTPTMLVFFIGAQTASSLFGVDADATRGYALAGVPWRHVLLGKQVSLGIVLTTPIVGLAVAAVLLGAAVDDTLGGLVLAGALFCGFMAVGAVLSVRLAFPLPTDATAGNPMATFLPSILGMALLLVLSVPLIGPAIGTAIAWGTNLPGALVGLGIGGSLWFVALRYADTWASTHEPELLARLALR